MATMDDLKSLDYGFAGEPFVMSVPSGVDLTTLDYGFAGEPFVTGFDEAPPVEYGKPFFWIFLGGL